MEGFINDVVVVFRPTKDTVILPTIFRGVLDPIVGSNEVRTYDTDHLPNDLSEEQKPQLILFVAPLLDGPRTSLASDKESIQKAYKYLSKKDTKVFYTLTSVGHSNLIRVGDNSMKEMPWLYLVQYTLSGGKIIDDAHYKTSTKTIRKALNLPEEQQHLIGVSHKAPPIRRRSARSPEPTTVSSLYLIVFLL